MFSSLLIIPVTLFLYVSGADVQPKDDHAPPQPDARANSVFQAQIMSPVLLSQQCAQEANYCVYLDQNRPGSVQLSPYSATDNQGAFLFERKVYATAPYYLCFGGCCISLDFQYKPGCVHMEYLVRNNGQPGHLLARFASDVTKIIGPREDMYQSLLACPDKPGEPLPYAVMAARLGGQKTEGAGGDVADGAVDPMSPQAANPFAGAGTNHPVSPQGGKAQNPPAGTQPKRIPHDYFDDVTVPYIHT